MNQSLNIPSTYPFKVEHSQDFYEMKLDTYHYTLGPEFSFYRLVKRPRKFVFFMNICNKMLVTERILMNNETSIIYM